MPGRAGMPSLRRRWTAAFVCAAFLGTFQAAAQTPADELARKHFDAAVAYLEERDYDNALKAFEKSYELSKRPEILLNIATVHEKRGDLPAAVGALKRYLEIAPENAHTASAKERLANLETRLHPPVEQGPAPEPEEPFVPRYGFLVAGGIAFLPEAGGLAFRGDAGFPVLVTSRTYLRLLAVVTFDYQSESDFKTYAIAPFATAQHGWFVLSRPKGQLSLVAEAGVGPVFAWIKSPDLPYMPSEWQSDVRFGARLAGLLEYQGRGGWLAAVQPLGLLLTVVDGDLEATLELALRFGYQWP
jgi:tetratricopeptide (TPR) repeat protein